MMRVLFKRKAHHSPGPHQVKQGSWPALIATGGIVYFIVAVVALHVLRPELNPIRHAVSNYAIGPFGFLMTSAFFTLALSECALALGLARSLTTSRAALASVLLLYLAGAGMAVTGIFPGDVKSLHPPATTTAVIHWTGASISFLSLMIATFLLSSCYKSDVRWQSFHHLAFALAVIIVLALGIFGILAIAGWVGIGERIYIATSVLWLLLVSMRLRSIAASSNPFS
ncbi:MAG TPA: DUF998 domain-containing protein [Ktedonobacteraceae bacterium]|nr:DUF998 domain-containing protein [Ktedonobacteraceae bacterium]